MTVDNLDPAVDNQDPAAPAPAPAVPAAPAAPVFSWKQGLPADYINSPTMQKFSDDKDGLSKAIESHLNLERLLGHQKIPLPKDDKDIEGIKLFNKALGVPDSPDGYGLKDAVLPESLKEMSFDKKTFAEVMHKRGVPPRYVNGLWEDYQAMTLGAYNKYNETNSAHLAELTNSLRAEFGDAYDSKVELGQMVINKFSADKDMEDFITASMLKDPRGVKFLAMIGSQFAENQIGSFKYQGFSFTPEQAKAELSKIRNDPNHPYLNPKATNEEHMAAVEYVNKLEAIAVKQAQG